MAAILTLALKDLKLQSRDWFGLFWIVGFPMMYAVFLGSIFAGIGEDDHAITLAVVDRIQSIRSHQFVVQLGQSKALRTELMSEDDARNVVVKGNKAGYLILRSGFADRGLIFTSTPPQVELGIDPSRRAESEMLKGLIMKAFLSTFQEAMALPKSRGNEAYSHFLQIDVRDTATIGNLPRNAFEISFPLAIIWAMLGCLNSFAVALVVERRDGTFLRLRAAPLSLYQILAGKGLACFLTCCSTLLLLLAFAAIFLGVHVSNPAMLTLAMVCTSACFTGIMMLVSTAGKTERSVAGVGWGIMMPLAMIGGGTVPLTFLPRWMVAISDFSPVKWAIVAMEGALWRHFTFIEVLMPCTVLLSIGGVAFTIGVLSVKRQQD